MQTARAVLLGAFLLPSIALAQDAGAPSCRQTIERLRELYLDAQWGLLEARDGSARPFRNTRACRGAEVRARRRWAAAQVEPGALEAACAKLSPEARACLAGQGARRPGDFDGCREEWRRTTDGGLADFFVFMADCAGVARQREPTESLEADRRGAPGGELAVLGEACSRRHAGVATLYAQFAAVTEKLVSRAPDAVVREACR